ncbi:MAG: hypothetical protein LBN05_09075 [Oscillospiraceae bacterium]|jgi:hypothetical protein|nr:hypothetical protein [Oscillospiraceae bacterium]
METVTRFTPPCDVSSTSSALKKALSVLLALLLVAGVFFVVPVGVFAENTGNWKWHYIDKNGDTVYQSEWDDNYNLIYDFSKVVGIAIDEYTGAATSVTPPATIEGYLRC